MRLRRSIHPEHSSVPGPGQLLTVEECCATSPGGFSCPEVSRHSLHSIRPNFGACSPNALSSMVMKEDLFERGCSQ
jgi:hypothetical protein